MNLPGNPFLPHWKNNEVAGTGGREEAGFWLLIEKPPSTGWCQRLLPEGRLGAKLNSAGNERAGISKDKGLPDSSVCPCHSHKEQTKAGECKPAADAAETPGLELTTTSTSDPGRKGRATGTSRLQKQRDYGRGVFRLGTGRATGL